MTTNAAAIHYVGGILLHLALGLLHAGAVIFVGVIVGLARDRGLAYGSVLEGARAIGLWPFLIGLAIGSFSYCLLGRYARAGRWVWAIPGGLALTPGFRDPAHLFLLHRGDEGLASVFITAPLFLTTGYALSISLLMLFVGRRDKPIWDQPE